MTLEAEAMVSTPTAAPRSLPWTRVFAWSVRRELWEYRSIYEAPLAVSVVVLIGLLGSTIGLPHRRAALLAADPAAGAAVVIQPYHVLAFPILATTFIVGIVYCLGALHGERRDRSILFWKSMPVSDLITVLAKAWVAMAILPAVAAAIIVALQVIMFAWVSALLAANGMNPFAPPVPLGQMTLVLVYGLITQTLWQAPSFGWLLLVSAWTRRGAPFLWAVLPPAALVLVEKLAFGTTHLGALLTDRVFGGEAQAFSGGASNFPMERLEQIDPVRFLTAPGLWLGLLAAAGMLVAAARLRRYRDPI